MRHKKTILYLCSAICSFLILISFAHAEDVPPTGQSKGRLITEEDGISADIYGEQGGRFHPFLILQDVYTDNLFNTHDQTKGDFVTTAAPGVWFAFPANRAKLLSIDTTSTSAGGLKMSRIKPEATRRYQSYFLYSPEFVFYSDFHDHNHVNQKVEGLFQYNLNSGLSFDLIDLFHDREEIAGNGVDDTLYRYHDNLANLIASYDAPSGKFKLQFNVSRYDLNYNETQVSYRDRQDDSYGVSAFYKFWPKTSLFLEYNYSNIEFNSAQTNDSVENRYYAGVTWDITAKTRGTLKSGYMDKDFDDSSVDDQEGFSFELQTQHNLNPKRALQVNAYRKFNESDLSNASSYLATGIDVGLLQRFTEKWSGTLNVFYENNGYDGFDRDDDLFGIGPALRFEPRKWLTFDFGYTYYQNDSNVTFFDYKAHRLFLRAAFAM